MTRVRDDADGAGVLVDARGLRCPLPVIRLAQAARDLEDGAVLILWATDPAAEHDVPAWARMRGHAVESTEHVTVDGAPHLVTTVRLGRARPETPTGSR